jgi:glucokinase
MPGSRKHTYVKVKVRMSLACHGGVWGSGGVVYKFVAFFPNGVFRCENRKSCSAAVSSPAASTAAAAAATGLVLEEERVGED